MKRIAILVETSLASGREIVTGISRFLDEKNDWSIFQNAGPLGAMDMQAIERWEGDGIIARIANAELLERIQEKNLPTVDVLGNINPLPFPLVKCNDDSIGVTVAKHFINHAHSQFAFVGLPDERWSLERELGFRREVELDGGSVSSFHLNQQESSWSRSDHLQAVQMWLSTLQAPIAIMVASDQLAPIIFEACHQLQLTIPENVSVVGVDNDHPFCNLCRPRLSSVEPNHQLVGYRAAEVLEQMLGGYELKHNVIEIDNHQLHSRLSSDLIAINDPALQKALYYVREYACTGIGLDDVAKSAGLSRSVLQRRFRQAIKRTVGDTILNEKLRTAREMLSNTELPISLVAQRSGFNCQEYMNAIFKKHLKTTPRKYRLR